MHYYVKRATLLFIYLFVCFPFSLICWSAYLLEFLYSQSIIIHPAGMAQPLGGVELHYHFTKDYKSVQTLSIKCTANLDIWKRNSVFRVYYHFRCTTIEDEKRCLELEKWKIIFSIQIFNRTGQEPALGPVHSHR